MHCKVSSAEICYIKQHAVLYSAKIERSISWSYEDESLDDMSEVEIRCASRNTGYLVAWILWHLARVEEMTMNEAWRIKGTRQEKTKPRGLKRPIDAA